MRNFTPRGFLYSQSVSQFFHGPDPRFLFSEFCTLLDATFKVQPSPRARYLSEHRRTRRGVPRMRPMATIVNSRFKNSFRSLNEGTSRHHSPRLSTRANSAPRDKRREARDREHDAIDDTSRPRPAAENMTNENETRTDGETPSPRQERSAYESGADSRLRSDLPSLPNLGESSDSRGCSQAAR